jgi:hypothetical protein
MSGTYAAVQLSSVEMDAIPSLEDVIGSLRWRHPYMTECLDERLQRQLALIEQLLAQKGWTAERLSALSKDEAGDLPEDLQLYFYILRDIEYIQSLR